MLVITLAALGGEVGHAQTSTPALPSQARQERQDRLRKRALKARRTQQAINPPPAMETAEKKRRRLEGVARVGAGAVNRQQAPIADRTLAASGTPSTSPLSQAGNPAKPTGAEAREQFREFITSLSPTERPAVFQYIQGLQARERKDLREMLIPLSAEDRKTKLLELTRSGRKPDSLEDLKRRAGVPLAPPLAPISIPPRNPESGTYRSSAADAAASRMPETGASAPSFTLERAGGGTISLDSFRGKPVVVEFGSITCPLYRGKIPAMTQLKWKYGNSAEFLLIYTLEAHPQGSPSPYSNGEWVPQKNRDDGQMKPQPGTRDQRLVYAGEAIQKLGETLTVAVDSMDNSTWRVFGARANSAFVIGPDGKVILAQEWTDPEGIDESLARLTGAGVAGKR